MKSNTEAEAAGLERFAHLRQAPADAAASMILEAGKKRRAESSALDTQPEGVSAQIIEAGVKSRGEE